MGQSKPFRRIAIIVEDDAAQRELVAVLLEESDLHVVECESAEAALTVLRHYGTDVAFLFADVALGGSMDGVELARFAKAHQPDCRVVVTSGRKCGRLPPGTRFMPKPWLALDILIEAEKSLAQ